MSGSTSIHTGHPDWTSYADDAPAVEYRANGKQLQRYPAIATLNTSIQYVSGALKLSALRRNRGIDAYLERRLSRQWRQRGS